MAFKAGTATYILLDGVNGAGTNVSRFADNFQWPQTTETVDVSAFGTAAKANIPSLTDGDVVQVSGPGDSAFFLQLAQVKAAQSAGSSTCTVVYAPGGSVSGEIKIQAEAWVTGLTVSSAVAGRVDLSASLQITGAVTNGVW